MHKFITYMVTCDHPKHLKLEVKVWCPSNVDPLIRAFTQSPELRGVPLAHGKNNEFKTRFTHKRVAVKTTKQNTD